jgi:hypothetical protein
MLSLSRSLSLPSLPYHIHFLLSPSNKRCNYQRKNATGYAKSQLMKHTRTTRLRAATRLLCLKKSSFIVVKS